MRSRRIRFAWVIASLVAAGCTEPDIADLAIETQTKPFYWYQDTTRIYLRIDSTSLTVAADSGLLPTLSASLAGLGVTVDSSTAMVVIAGHWTLWLHPGTRSAAAAVAARALRLHGGASFASNAYLYGTPPTECRLWLANRLLVKYRASTTAEQITALQERAGFTVERAPAGASWPVWVLRYPPGSPYTPLEIAAAVYRHPFVDWASADMGGCMRMWGGERSK